MDAILGSVFLVIFAGTIVGGVIWSVMRSMNAARRQDDEIRNKLGKDIRIDRDFPLPLASERTVLEVMKGDISSIRYVITAKKWLFAQLTNRWLPAFTNAEDRDGLVLSLYVAELSSFTPEIAIRQSNQNNFLARLIQSKVEKEELIPCEAVFQEAQRVFADPGIAIDVLSILSPEVLEACKNPPYGADIYLKRDKLYYLYSNTVGAETAVPVLQNHAQTLVTELEDNLHRWARAPQNSALLEQIKDAPQAQALVDQWRNDENGRTLL